MTGSKTMNQMIKTAKKVLATLSAAAVLSVMVPVTPVPLTPHTGFGTMPLFTTVAEAAKGGARMSRTAPTPAPRTTPAPSASSNGANSGKSVSGNGGSYQPSKPANTLSKEAPSASATRPSTASPAPQQQQSSSRLGSFLRGAGLFAGGMMLGSLFSHALGFGGVGGGFGSDVMGLIFNLIFLYIAYRVIRYVWNRFREKKTNNYQAPYQNNSMPQSHATSYTPGTEPIDITPQTTTSARDVTNGSYDPKRTADRYRNA